MGLAFEFVPEVEVEGILYNFSNFQVLDQPKKYDDGTYDFYVAGGPMLENRWHITAKKI